MGSWWHRVFLILKYWWICLGLRFWARPKVTRIVHVFNEKTGKEMRGHYTDWFGEPGSQLGHDCACGADLFPLDEEVWAIWHLRMWRPSEQRAA